MIFKVVILHSAEHDLKELRHYLTSRFPTQAWRGS